MIAGLPLACFHPIYGEKQGPTMSNQLFTKLWKLPSGSIVKVTRELREPMDNGEDSPFPLLGAVYVSSADLSMKRLEVRKDWFEAHAVVA